MKQTKTEINKTKPNSKWRKMSLRISLWKQRKLKLARAEKESAEQKQSWKQIKRKSWVCSQSSIYNTLQCMLLFHISLPLMVLGSVNTHDQKDQAFQLSITTSS